jgi:hypothetical protein
MDILLSINGYTVDMLAKMQDIAHKGTCSFGYRQTLDYAVNKAFEEFVAKYQDNSKQTCEFCNSFARCASVDGVMLCMKCERIKELEQDIADLRSGKVPIEEIPWSNSVTGAPIHEIADEIENLVGGTPGTWPTKIHNIIQERDDLQDSLSIYPSWIEFPADCPECKTTNLCYFTVFEKVWCSNCRKEIKYEFSDKTQD